MNKAFVLNRETVIQFLKFGVIGVLGFVVDFAMFHVGRDGLGFGAYGSAFFSFPFAVLATWVGNRFFTFRDKNAGAAHTQLMRFAAVCVVGLVLNRGTFSLLTYFVPLVAAYPVLGLLGGTGAGMFFNFFFSRLLVFR